LQLHLVEAPLRTLRALAIKVAPQLLDGKPQMGDQAWSLARSTPDLGSLGSGGDERRLQGADVIGQG
jgi:hypothetical protein